MTLPAEASRHHTVWVTHPSGLGTAERYGTDGNRLVVFGDRSLADLHDGDHVSATIHEIHNGPPLVTFSVIVHELRPADVGLGVFADVVGNRSLNVPYAQEKASRRLLALDAA